MRRFLMCTAVIALAWTGMVGAQMKITTPEDHDKAMKAIGGAFGGVMKAAATSPADAKAGLTTMRANFVAVEEFWTARKKEAQVNYAKQAIAGIDATVKAIDSGGDAAGAAKAIGGACGGCHKESRDPDPANEKSFIIKPALLQ